MNTATPDTASDVQTRLLRATETLIYQGGIHATGMDAIVKASGVARKSVYKHYPTKDALVAAALQARDERWMQWFIAATTQAAVSTGKPGVSLQLGKAKSDKHACQGQNSCKGKGGCKTGDNGCKSKNSCKGKGGCATDGSKPAPK